MIVIDAESELGVPRSILGRFCSVHLAVNSLENGMNPSSRYGLNSMTNWDLLTGGGDPFRRRKNTEFKTSLNRVGLYQAIPAHSTASMTAVKCCSSTILLEYGTHIQCCSGNRSNVRCNFH